jgi:hypothetical protein
MMLHRVVQRKSTDISEEHITPSSVSEMSVHFHRAARCCIPEYKTLQRVNIMILVAIDGVSISNWIY